MGQRNITVDGKNYRYSIGATHVKITGFPAVPKGHVGEIVPLWCDCCGKGGQIEGYAVQVTPKHISEYIRKNISIGRDLCS